MSSSPFHGIFSTLMGGKVGVTPEGPESVLSQRDQKSTGGMGQIALDIFEDGGYLIIRAPLAGVKLADLDIDVADTVVTIRGKREHCDSLTGEQYYLQECYWGEFSRSVTLPFSVNPTRVKATFSKDNVLKVFIPKEERRVKIVKINEGG